MVAAAKQPTPRIKESYLSVSMSEKNDPHKEGDDRFDANGH